MHMTAVDFSGTTIIFEGIIKQDKIDGAISTLVENLAEFKIGEEDEPIADKITCNKKNIAKKTGLKTLDGLFTKYKSGELAKIACIIEDVNENTDSVTIEKTARGEDKISLEYETQVAEEMDGLWRWDDMKRAFAIDSSTESSPATLLIGEHRITVPLSIETIMTISKHVSSPDIYLGNEDDEIGEEAEDKPTL